MRATKDSRLCPACAAANMEVFFRVDSVPTNSCILLDSREAALAWPRGRIALAFCEHCGFILNTGFDPALTEYSQRYEETQGFSPTFQVFHRELASGLIRRHDLHGKKIVEIGCGKGEFLHLLCALGNNQGLGFDPSYIPDRDQTLQGEDVQFIADYFPGEQVVEQADFVACKMTLEHIPETGRFVQTIRDAVQGGPETVVFIQVPEATRILKDCAFEDIYYEHCSYFVPQSLAGLMQRHGFDVIGTDVTYAGQYLTVEARFCTRPEEMSQPAGSDLDGIRRLVESFPGRVTARIEHWREEIRGRLSAGQTVVIWGSGSKGVSFLTTLGIDEGIGHVVDINPHRQGHYMAGTGQQIVGPAQLRDLRPDCVVAMNAVYRDEIRDMLAEQGLEPELLAL